MKDKLLSIIIVSYNSGNFIQRCLSSVIKYLPQNAEVIVLDNASTDNTVEKLEKYVPKIKLIKSTKNLGFAKGNNLASKEAKGEYLFLLNPDTEMKERVFEELVKFYESNKNIGITAPKLVRPNGNTQASVRKLPTVWGAFKEYILGFSAEYSEFVPKAAQPVEVEYVYAAAILIKRELFNKLGGFDEKYFLYYEDADLCKRVMDLGLKIYYYPQVSIRHIVGGTQSETDKNKLNFNSAIKFHGIFKALILQGIFRLHHYLSVG